MTRSTYQRLELLGRGGMGEVYRGEHRHTRTAVALKQLRSDLEDLPRAVELFAGEIEALRAISHPNVVALRDVIDDRGQTVIVLDYLHGQRLCDLPVLAADIGWITAELLAGLQAIHDAGFTHGDVKAANIIVSTTPGRRHATLIDLGLAQPFRAYRAPGSPASGTPTHMAPELVRGESATARSDVYAAGVVLYEMLAGAPPFPGTGQEVLLRHLHDEPRAPSQSLRVGEHTPIDAVVLAALAKDPARRFGSAAEMSTAVSAALERSDLTTWLSVPCDARATVDLRTHAGGRTWQPRRDQRVMPCP